MGVNAGENIGTGSDNIEIANGGTSTDSGTIRIGTQGTQSATFVAGINGVDASAGLPVYILSTGQLGTGTSAILLSAPGEKDSKSLSPMTRYQAANAKLRNDLNKQEIKIVELKALVAKQQATIDQQQKGMETLAATLKEQASKIQKVSDEVELKKPAPQTAANK
jgi:uncharacterized coiled-coil protein SlyX